MAWTRKSRIVGQCAAVAANYRVDGRGIDPTVHVAMADHEAVDLLGERLHARFFRASP